MIDLPPFSEIQKLLYPLGFLSSIPFFLRFFIQWLSSEKAGRSYVTPLFWRLSLVGNLLLFSHAWLQQQLPIFLAQGLSGLIASRNLTLMKGAPKAGSFSKTAFLFFLLLLLSIPLFLIPSWFFGEGPIHFLRVPLHAWQKIDHAPLSIHLIGISGQALFSLRFIVQWWQAEHELKSSLSRQFWWISLCGGLLSLIYALIIVDIVNIVGPLCNLIPSLRNLMLLDRKEAA